MSRADIVQVTTLAAHLADKWRVANPVAAIDPAFPWSISDPTVSVASGCARDAMLLQKLGRSIRTQTGKNLSGHPDQDHRAQKSLGALRWQALGVLRPYGLTAELADNCPGPCLLIRGLPGNDLGGNTEGFQI